ncbi:MAG: hypothetical protein QXH56_05675 [Thermoprotei archaeon]
MFFISDPHKPASRPRLRLVVYLALAKLIVLSSVVFSQGSISGLSRLNAWDSLIFEAIAEKGYIEPEYYAFSPVYPAIIRILHISFGLSYTLSAFLATNILSFIFPLIVYETCGYTAALLTEFMPTYIVFTTLPYSDVIVLTAMGTSIMLLLRKNVGWRVGLCLSLAVATFYNMIYTLPAYLFWTIGGGVKSSVDRSIKVFLPTLLTLFGVVLWYSHAHGVFYYFSLEHKLWGVTLVTPLQQAQWLLDTNGTGWFTAKTIYVLGLPLTPLYWFLRNIVFEAFYTVGIVLLVLKGKNPARFFLEFYSVTVVVPLLLLLGIPAISIPRLLLPAFPAVWGYAAIMSRRDMVVYLAVCVAGTVWITLNQAYAFFA